MALIRAYNQHPNPENVMDDDDFNRLYASAKYVEKSLATQIIQTLGEALNQK